MVNPFRLVVLAAHRALCATRGHDTLLQIEPHRLSLRCVSCGHETTGWTIGEPAPQAPRASAAQRRRVETRRAA
jgi:hypothetical protein